MYLCFPGMLEYYISPLFAQSWINASTIWNPYFMKDIRKLEAVQRRATKLIPSLHDMTYSQRLQ